MLLHLKSIYIGAFYFVESHGDDCESNDATDLFRGMRMRKKSPETQQQSGYIPRSEQERSKNSFSMRLKHNSRRYD